MGKKYPYAWTLINKMLNSRDKFSPWPKWCFLPLSIFYSIVSHHIDDSLLLHYSADISRLGALGTWRYTQGIYKFDPDVMEKLKDTTIVGQMPSDVFLRLPEWCIYIVTPTLFSWHSSKVFGFFAHLEWDVNTGRKELRFLIDTEKSLEPIILHLGSWTVKEAIYKCLVEAKKFAPGQLNFPEKFIETTEQKIQPFLAALLYICSDKPEIENDRVPGIYPSFAKAKKTKKGWQWFPADPKIWNVGHNTGEQIRKTQIDYNSELIKDNFQSKSVKPHIRRAHWHGYWTGSRKENATEEERHFIYHWLPPIFIT